MNTIGTLFRLTSFGESHGVALGGVIDGMPSGIEVDMNFVQAELDRRRPGQSKIVTPRNEKDRVEILSGIFEGKTTGTPIGFVIYNDNQHSSDYDNMREVYRPSHADYTYESKYGIRDHRGGGRSSARETVSRCVAGAFAKLALRQYGIKVMAYTAQVGPLKMDSEQYEDVDFTKIEDNAVRCPDQELAQKMYDYIAQIKAEGDSVGGVVSCYATGVPVGLGEPVFNKLHADLGAAMLSINAAKGVEFGMGFDGVGQRGSECNDAFYVGANSVMTHTNNSGGIQGGISNGQPIFMRVAFKPVATLLKDVHTINRNLKEVVLKAKGRHDPCVLPRAVPIVEAMAAIILLDHLLQSRSRHNF